MAPNRPYILRAYYEWLTDNQLTPHLVVDATIVGTVVPRQFVQDGQIVLNISSTAVQGLQLGNDEIRFSARFSGQPMQVILPLAAVIAIYARENGAGQVFEPEEAYENQADLELEQEVAIDEVDEKPKPKKGNHLTLVK
ncbi:ClpXP protease specificity-enhancing factor [Paraferrimonas sp. SM1919]|uniref:ClpXP protease specificity-enhancing factor n=1 Tax=Paraferrimonas sp. SM1919 TaxID=2662263 RepID=UPI0013D6A7E3|nr:ClpXP protease specificity-enhancing factor [Paraferrimonas sp. SM1919]